MRPIAGGLLLMSTIGFLSQRATAPAGPLPTYTFSIVRSYPHDRGAFIQGLIVSNGFFYEGTGLNGKSGIRKVKIETGEVLQAKPLGAEYFGEGITEWKGSILQLTWQNEIGFVYDVNTFERTKTWTYKGEGWGLTHDGTRLIMSDGTAQLRFVDPVTLKETGRITVRDQRGPVQSLNELEYVKGEIFANIWQTDRIARISPKDGRVVGWIDLSGLLSAAERGTPDAVLNGIAYDAAADRLFVTGKLWPRVFEIKLVPRGASRGGA
jgi:glutaminyl-peptide cyclotransferase